MAHTDGHLILRRYNRPQFYELRQSADHSARDFTDRNSGPHAAAPAPAAIPSLPLAAGAPFDTPVHGHD